MRRNIKEMRVKHPRAKRSILNVLNRDWQTSAEISYKSGRSSAEVCMNLNWVARLGYVEKMRYGRIHVWRLKEGLTVDLVTELLQKQMRSIGEPVS